MLKQVTIPVESSNIAGFGSHEDHELRQKAAESEVEFKGAGDELGLQVWRIEKLQVKAWPRERYGTFYTGDAYIVLNTYLKGEKKCYNLHFWLGKSCSQDEQGAAAYLTVVLDDLLGTLPVQFREVQDYESHEFLAIFPQLLLLDGGIDSGFNHVTPEEYQPRLLQVKGTRRNVRAFQVPLAVDSLNDGDSFILDAGLQIYVWQGSSSGPFEKSKAIEVATAIKNDRQGRPHVTVVPSGDEGDAFWAALGGRGAVRSAAAGGADDDQKDYSKGLWRLTDSQNGVLTIGQVAEGSLARGALDSSDVFFVDVGHTLYVWIGKHTSKQERTKAVQFANLFLQNQGRPAHTLVSRLVEDGESDAFWSAFDA
eukprot:TRINITY_DN3683_c0_g1_i2.p1 TRINITY_DN3683_c0_g1~~TRINITY_DN3683_c0_g1_i2.p1  ORF type:complete len:367 (+),score=176.05 TRINITY_DN3683_c0_g1_i2:64-1164(+)